MSTPTHDRHIADLERDLATAIAERDGLAETRAALTANLNAMTVDVATMRAELDEARRALAEMWSVAWLLMWRAIGDSISADDWCNEWARSPSPEAFAEVTRERDAYRDGKRLSAWERVPERPWGHGKTVEEWTRKGATFVHVSCIRKDGIGKAWGMCQGLSMEFETADAARAAVDAQCAVNGYWLEGGAHKAGEAK